MLNHVLIVLLVPPPAQSTIGVLQLIQTIKKIGASNGKGIAMPATPLDPQAVASDRPQPTAKGADLVPPLKLRKLPHNNGQHLLNHVFVIRSTFSELP